MSSHVPFVTVDSVEVGIETAKRIIDQLTGKTFDIYTCHSGEVRGNEGEVQENRTLKSCEPVVSGFLVKIQLSPSRSISFDSLKDQPLVYFSDRVIKIKRRLFGGHSLTKIIIIQK